MKASKKELSVEKSLYLQNTTTSLKTSPAWRHKGNGAKIIFVLYYHNALGIISCICYKNN